MKTPREELIDFIMGMTEEQVDKVLSRLDMLENLAAMNDYQATYTKHLTGKLFFSK